MGTLLAVFAHPDDETFMCGGTLAKVALQGHRVAVVCATKGEMGRRMGNPPVATRESLALLREQEMQRACAALSVAQLSWLGFRDKTLEMEPQNYLLEAVLAQMETERPEVILTFHPEFGGHPDHCAIGLAATAAYQAYRATREDTCLYYVAWANMGWLRNTEQIEDWLEEDVHAYLAPKLQAFRAHRTQSGIYRWLWQRDSASMRKLAATEYFISAGGPVRRSVLPSS